MKVVPGKPHFGDIWIPIYPKCVVFAGSNTCYTLHYVRET